MQAQLNKWVFNYGCLFRVILFIRKIIMNYAGCCLIDFKLSIAECSSFLEIKSVRFAKFFTLEKKKNTFQEEEYKWNMFE